MANTNPITKDTENNVWPYEIEIRGSGWTQTHTFNTLNKFVDANIAVKAHTDAAGALSLSLTDKTNELSMGNASGGYYTPTISLSGSAAPATAGWITTTAQTVTDNSVKVGKVVQSGMNDGTDSINSGATINPTTTSQTINITAGYNAARTLIVGPVSSGPKGTATSGTASIGTLAYEYDSANTRFNVSSTATVSAPVINPAGYLSGDSDPAIGGTKNSSSNTVTSTVERVTVGSKVVGTFVKPKPVILRTEKSGRDWVDAASGAGVPSTTEGKRYVQVDAAAVSATLTTNGKVTKAGYGTIDVYGESSNLVTDVGTQPASTLYVPIKEATIVQPTINTATFSGPTYQTTGTNAGSFEVNATGTIGSPTITEGYISNTIGTKTPGSFNVTTTLSKVTVGTAIDSGTSGKVTPVISRTEKPNTDTWTDAASGAATGTKPSSGVYVQVDAPAINSTVVVKGTVSQAGYGTTSNYTTGTKTTVVAGTENAQTKYIPIKSASGFSASIGSVTSSSLTVGNKTSGSYPITSNLSIPATITASNPGWFTSGNATGSKNTVAIGSIPEATFSVNGGAVTVNTAGYVPASFPVTTLDTATFTNTAASGVTYTDESANAPVLQSGDYLYVNAGYTGNIKISLAKLVPDAADIGSAETSPYLLVGHSAYNSDGQLVGGGMQIYDGSYTVT